MSGPLAHTDPSPADRSLPLRVGAGALALALMAILAGCSSTASTKSTDTPTATPIAPAPSRTPTPTPSPTFAALQYTCASILPPATLTVFKSKQSGGFTLQSDYLQRMKNIGSPLVAFATYGGILCQWAYPDAENSVDYAFSAITDTEAATEQQTLTSTGYVGAQKDHGTLFANTDTADYPDEYLFINGYWFQASSDSVMQLLIDNVFVQTS